MAVTVFRTGARAFVRLWYSRVNSSQIPTSLRINETLEMMRRFETELNRSFSSRLKFLMILFSGSLSFSRLPVHIKVTVLRVNRVNRVTTTGLITQHAVTLERHEVEAVSLLSGSSVTWWSCTGKTP